MVPWETRFQQLKNFAEKYGHAQIPIGWEENVPLSNWVSKQVSIVIVLDLHRT